MLYHRFRTAGFAFLGLAILFAKHAPGETMAEQAEAARDVLRLSVYCTADSVRGFTDEAGRKDAVNILRQAGVTRVFLEVRRGGTGLTEAELIPIRDYFASAGFAVAGGIATVPGGDWGVPANEGLAWLNYESPKTQADVEATVRAAARVFDDVIVDDFLLSADTSALSDTARQGRDWGEYRRDLLADVSRRVIVGPAREENPGITVILKFPQSYDRYHNFGYDVAREPEIYDQVWVGTETRGQYTQRFGFTQPYEGFVNYRWIASLSRGKMGGAWFDHIDCDGTDFVEQAWQTVLAGAREIMLFSYASLQAAEPGYALLRRDFPGLVQLARAIREQPVTGVAAYKPPNSDPGSDLYCMDFIGMLGVPLVPVSTFPGGTDTLFLPAYCAKEPEIVNTIGQALAAGKNVVITAGLLASVDERERLARLAGVKPLEQVTHIRTGTVLLDGETVEVPRGLDLAAEMVPKEADVLLNAVVDGRPVPFLTSHAVGTGRLSVLNIHQFTPEDFATVNEVLLSPRNLGLLDIPRAWANTMRRQFAGGGELLSDAPTRVTIQPIGDRGWFIQNYNNAPALITLGGGDVRLGALHDGFTGEPLLQKGNVMQRKLPPRSRLWVAR